VVADNVVATRYLPSGCSQSFIASSLKGVRVLMRASGGWSVTEASVTSG
jgi:hypothetical protein